VYPYSNPSFRFQACAFEYFTMKLYGSFLIVTMAMCSSVLDAQQANEGAVKNPVKVFLLAGQSNMCGAGSVDHLLKIINDEDNNEENEPKNEFREALWDEDTNNFKVRDDVFIKYKNAQGPAMDAEGNLTIGKDTRYAYQDRFGVEAMFGVTVGDVYDEPVYLIKTAWGGRDIAVDFRPPSSGEGNYEGIKPSHYGWQYRMMIDEINQGLEAIQQVVPGYDPQVGYEIAGLVWFQGWNDFCCGKIDEYAFNLKNLIRDVRKELDLPELPWVIGELGNHGLHLPKNDMGDRVRAFRTTANSVALMPEFYHSTKYVETAQYAVMGLDESEQFDGIHHYFGRAEPYFHIGQALALGMLDLLGVRTDKDTSD
jgi:hypothetical protein